MKRLVRDSNLLHLAIYNILNDTQHEFMHKSSTLTDRLCTQEDDSSLIDAKQDADMVFLNLSKSFDAVNYILLLAKLESIVISQTICGWVESFLGNHSLRRPFSPNVPYLH